MDYSESIIWIRNFARKAEDALNKRDFVAALDSTEHIMAEAKQLEETIKNIIAVRSEEEV